MNHSIAWDANSEDVVLMQAEREFISPHGTPAQFVWISTFRQNEVVLLQSIFLDLLAGSGDGLHVAEVEATRLHVRNRKVRNFGRRLGRSPPLRDAGSHRSQIPKAGSDGGPQVRTVAKMRLGQSVKVGEGLAALGTHGVGLVQDRRDTSLLRQWGLFRQWET